MICAELDCRMQARWSIRFVVALVATVSAQRPAPGLTDSAGALITGAPFSALQVTTWQQTPASGQLITRQQRVMIDRDGAGRLRTERSPNNSSDASPTLITIYDPVNAFVYELNATSRTGIRMPTEISELPHVSDSTGSPVQAMSANVKVQTTELGTRVVNGVSAIGTRTTLTFAAGEFGTAQAFETDLEKWVSPALRRPVLTTVFESPSSQTVTELTNIVLGEPDPALFQVPIGYVIRIWPSRRLPRST
jgi:hypothetical protein